MPSLDPSRSVTHGQEWAGRFRQHMRRKSPDVRFAFWIEAASDMVSLTPAEGETLYVCPETNYSVCHCFRCTVSMIPDVGLCCTVVRPWQFITSIDWIAGYFDEVHTAGKSFVLKCSALHWCHLHSEGLFAIIEPLDESEGDAADTGILTR
jgi:hypothetical protein